MIRLAKPSLLPSIESGGPRWRKHRQVINAVLWKLRIGAPWRDLPERYGPWKTAHERLRIWTKDGTWERVLDHVIVKDDSIGNVEWTFSIDAATSGPTNTPPGPGKGGCTAAVGRGPHRRRRSPRTVRGGLTSKIHLAVDGCGLPMPLHCCRLRVSERPL